MREKMTSMMVVTIVLGVLGSTACSSSGDSAPAKDCVADATRTCACADKKSGSQVCSSDGFWKACTCGSCPVTPSCTGKACGDDDGCGAKCLTGSCPSGQSCVSGACSGSCPGGAKCTGKACGDPDECGGICTTVACPKPGYTCVATAIDSAKCVCKPVCTTCGGDDTCGGKCTTGACPAGFKCSGTACDVDPASAWVITITDGSIPVDKSWNTFSKPDSMVCLWIGGSRLCTSESVDTLSPKWGCAFPPVKASVLLAGVDVETFDNDRSTAGICAENLTTAAIGDAICTKGTVPLTLANFKSKSWGGGCSPLMTFNATLAPL